MTNPERMEWAQQNTATNTALLDVLLEQVRSAVSTRPGHETALIAARARLDEVARSLEYEPAVVVLSELFDLDGFERDVVMLAFGYEVDERFGDLATPLTAGLAVAALPNSAWLQLGPDFDLRAWHLIEVESEAPLIRATLRLDPHVRSFLLGVALSLEADGMHGVVASTPGAATVDDEATGRLLAAVTDRQTEAGPVVAIHGGVQRHRHDLALAVADALGVNLYWTPVAELPEIGPELTAHLRSVSRDARLHHDAVLLEVDARSHDAEIARVEAAVRLLDVPVVVSCSRPAVFESGRPVVWHEIAAPRPDARARAWRAGLDGVTGTHSRKGSGRRPATKQLDAAAARLAQDFTLDLAEVARLCAEVDESLGPESGRALSEVVPALRAAARRGTRIALERLATRLPTDRLPELVLPPVQAEGIEDFETFVRHAYQVDERWEMGQGDERGVTALFHGAPGTGKTLAARTLGHRLDLDVFRVDLSQTVSKYIGETERNLDQVFDAAERGGVLVLFDEADSLFGRRAEVKDAQDRFANLQVSYLLQRIESSTAPIVLTTNLRDAIDPAFFRRLRVIVEFPFPDAAGRAELWRKAFAPAVPTDGLHPGQLAGLAVTGATIADIARRAAFLAARSGSPVTRELVRAAATRELRKLDRDVVGDF